MENVESLVNAIHVIINYRRNTRIINKFLFAFVAISSIY
jgi:hypothetical protein